MEVVRALLSVTRNPGVLVTDVIKCKDDAWAVRNCRACSTGISRRPTVVELEDWISSMYSFAVILRRNTAIMRQ